MAEDWCDALTLLLTDQRDGEAERTVNRDRCWEYLLMSRDAYATAIGRAQRGAIGVVGLVVLFDLVKSAQVAELSIFGVTIQNLGLLMRLIFVLMCAAFVEISRAAVQSYDQRLRTRYVLNLIGVYQPGQKGYEIGLLPAISTRFMVDVTVGRLTRVLRVTVGMAMLVGWLVLPFLVTIRVVWTIWDRTSHDVWLWLTFGLSGVLLLMVVINFAYIFNVIQSAPEA